MPMERQGKKADRKLKNELETLESKRTELNRDLDRLRKSSGNAWQEMKQGILNAASELDRGFEEAQREFEKDTSGR